MVLSVFLAHTVLVVSQTTTERIDMKQAKIQSRKLQSLTEDFLNTAITNDFSFIGVSDYNLANIYRLKGVKQLRFCKEYLAFAYDRLGNKTVLTTDGTVLQF